MRQSLRAIACIVFAAVATPVALAVPPCRYVPAEGCNGFATYSVENDETYWYESCPTYFAAGTFSGNQVGLICG